MKNWVFWLIFAGVIVAALVLFQLIAYLVSGNNFLEWSNLKGIISRSAYPCFIAWGFCFLFACGYTDMSIGGVVVLGSFASCILGNWFGLPGVIIGGLAVGLLLIFINFLIFTYSGIPSWIAGISLAMIYEAIAFLLKISKGTKALISTSLAKEYRVLGQLPWCLILLLIGLVIVYFIYNRTTVGLNIRALGGNKDVAEKLGINTKKTLLFVGLIAGILVGVSCVLQQSYAGQTTVKTGLTSINMIFQPLAIYLLAQIIRERINIVVCVPICAFILYSIFNLLTMLGVPSGTLQEAFLGAFIVIFGIIGSRKVKGVVK
ncbi:MAG: ABC transporter permease [Oscillospiraceae bacterium]|nr:ABC transporter permease [Oscillospiraceae bacterium]